MIDRLLKIHLEPIARQRRRGRLLRSLSLGWLAVVGVGLFCLLLRVTTGWRSPWTFLLLFVAAVVWTLVASVRNRAREEDYLEIAREIEKQNPDLHTVLLTAIEQGPDPETGELNYLQERTIREALAHDRNHVWRAAASRELAYRRLGALATLVVLVVVLRPLYQAAPPKRVLLALTGQTVVVTPGDTSIEKGTSLVVLAKFGGEVPAEASLVIRPANEPERRIPLAKNLDDPVFGASVPEVNGELTYRVEYGGTATRDFKATTFEFPRLERADAKLTYPEYTGLTAKEIQDTRRVSAVEGTALDYTFHLNKPVKSAKLVEVRNQTEKGRNSPNPPTSGNGYTLAADNDRPNVQTLSARLEKNGRYELILVDEAGRTNKMPPQFVFEALTNRTPELKFAFPRGDQRVSALEEIAFQAETSDDFGLKAYGIAYNLAGQETKFVELGQSVGPHEKRTFNQLVPLESLNAQPDQLLNYYIWADDIGPDGKVRRTSSDMFFAEVRPFEEIFREGQGQEGNSGQQKQQQSGGQNAAEKLAELQKQIITATWNLQRRESRGTPSSGYAKDAEVVKDSQEDALEQVRTRREQVDDPRSGAMLDSVIKEMEKAAEHLDRAASKNSLEPLPPALSSEQSAYQALLRLAAREYQVSRANRNNQSGQSGGRNNRAQRQLNELDLKQSENKYETERQAAPPQNPQQREQLQAFNRLKELAQRQQDVNERLKELQAALQEAKTPAEREELLRRLKRLEEEQQQMLADVDELRQRMERPENQSEMAEARKQLEDTRQEVQQAADAMNRGEVSQALSSGTRAQRDLQQMRDDFRKQNSSQFAEDMRSMRNEARELAQKQDEIGQKLDSLDDPKARKTLTDSDERKELATELDSQKKRMEDLVKHATDVTKKAEAVEPLLSRQLYDTLRKAAQDDTKNLQDTRDELAGQGRLRVNVDQYLRSAKENSRNTVEAAAEMLREGFLTEADSLERRARRSIQEFKGGVERAAQSVLGDDTEALRFAQRELEDLAAQLEREIAQAQGRSGGGTNGATGARREQTDEATNNTNRAALASVSKEGSTNAQARAGQGQEQAQNQASSEQGQRNGERQSGNQTGQNEGQPGQTGQSDKSDQQAASGNQGRGSANNQQPEGERRNGGRNFYDQFGGREGGWDGGYWGGPLTGPDYTRWSDRMRDVEESLDLPELRAQAARIRDRARDVRVELKRHSREPQWDLVKLEIANQLTELRTRIAEELTRRESKESLVPIDRDPVPTRYSELVRHYYEQLGKSESAGATDSGAKQ